MIRVISYGGGVQSTALLVLAAQQRIDFGTFLFANTGDDSEDPATLDYLHRYAQPYAAVHGIELHELHRTRRDGSVETLYGRLTREGSRSLPIPVRMSNGAPGTRSCTADFKIKVVGRWLKEHGARPNTPATVGIGISLDEIERVNRRRAMPYEIPVYPLLDLRPPMRRHDCELVIAAAGLPIPSKSACWFCPLKPVRRWAEMRRDREALFREACALEALLNARRCSLGRDPVWLTRFNMPLARAVQVAQGMLPGFGDDDGTCDNGACFT
ncbi:phosphoadenosine phosphosulfate reductase [Dactylosporangium sp. AC04546]|uniref:phosphoadenosine phosphosulfate reductase n=1 Tax=Dactylosporangium sp. AC04546 TaxID=2862460 RepID=UPI001EDEF307|nr:phosphoadenosine phosphosulfate reductase [Dactylosporangium sp. AC04546]WVK80447.1 phosphoadenosine phosphosulfate reductase [Dactylosporangium sp. AC04546]